MENLSPEGLERIATILEEELEYYVFTDVDRYKILEKLASKYREAFYEVIRKAEQKLCPTQEYYKKKVSK